MQTLMSSADGEGASGQLELFHDACRRGNLANAYDVFTQRFAILNEAGSLGYTALHWAASAGHIDVAKMLLQEKASVDAVSSEGETPLHLASAKGHAAIATLLADAGADTGVKNKAGQTPLDVRDKHHGF